MTRNSIEDLAIQPVKNPNRSDSDLSQKVKPFGLKIDHRYCLTECQGSCNSVPSRTISFSLEYRLNRARGRIRTCTGDVLNVVSLLLDYASCWRRATNKWSLQPVMLRRDFLTREACRLLRGGNENGGSPR